MLNVEHLNPTHLHLGLLSLFFLVTWIPCVKGKWCSDDHEGINRFSDKYNPKEYKKIDSYEYKVGDKKIQFKHTQFNPHIVFPGSVIRWLRLNLGKKFSVIGKNEKGHEVFGSVQDPVRHHAISLTVAFANTILIYFFISKLFGPQLAFYTTLLFIVHPTACQTIAWCSGIGYLLCLFGALSAFNLALYIDNVFLKVHLVAFFSLFSAWGLFPGNLNFIILGFLGFWPAAIASGLACAFNGYKQSKNILGLRIKEFKKQNMGQSTFLNWHKPIVMCKTLWYYTLFTVYPKRLGLFHKWGYHYDEKTERINGMAVGGFFVLVGLCLGLYYGPPPVQLGILWWLVYIATFSNFITAMQFVADRYAYIPALGYSLILAYVFQENIPILTFIVGFYMMRCWAHIPTFQDEVKFYQSNIWNFPNSEVAYGNLGVALMHRGKPGAAVDAWFEAVKQNENYDVPHYNLYSIFRSNGQFWPALTHLRNCLKSKIVHFPDVWNKELKNLEAQIGMQKPLGQHLKEIYGGDK